MWKHGTFSDPKCYCCGRDLRIDMSEFEPVSPEEAQDAARLLLAGKDEADAAYRAHKERKP
jgi:hypothetical protein